jgi:hypothetical protein
MPSAVSGDEEFTFLATQEVMNRLRVKLAATYKFKDERQLDIFMNVISQEIFEFIASNSENVGHG